MSSLPNSWGFWRQEARESSMNLPLILPLPLTHLRVKAEEVRGWKEPRICFLTGPVSGIGNSANDENWLFFLGTFRVCSETIRKNVHILWHGQSICSLSLPVSILLLGIFQKSLHRRSFGCGLAAPKGSPLEQDSKSFSLSLLSPNTFLLFSSLPTSNSWEISPFF